MGYENATLEKVLVICNKVFSKFQGIRMFELGNQEVYSIEKAYPLFQQMNYRPISPIAKYFFQHLGFIHVSVDYNGLDGAFQYDVRQDISSKFTERFDILTNLGFTEHVGEKDDFKNLMSSQYAIFKNLHDLGAVGAVYYHCVPFTRRWYKHGVCDYSLEFFKTLADVCKYEIIMGPFIETYHPEDQASVFYRKTAESIFPSFEDFCKIDGLRSTEND
jgi:hypothetical protein